MDVLDNTEPRHNGKSLESVLTDGYSFNMGDYINKGFKLFGNDAGSYIGFTLVSFVISFVVGLIPFLGTIAGLFVSPALNGGWYIFGQKHNSGQQRSFSNFFDAFKNPPWIQLVLGSLVSSIFIALAAAVIIVPAVIFLGAGFITDIMSLQNNTDPDEVMAIFAAIFTGKIFLTILLAALIASLVAALYIFMPQFIIFRGMAFWDAMEASRKVVMKNYIQVVLFLIVLSIIAFIGALLCGLGLLVAIPLFFLAVHSAFEDIMGTGDSTQA